MSTSRNLAAMWNEMGVRPMLVPGHEALGDGRELSNDVLLWGQERQEFLNPVEWGIKEIFLLVTDQDSPNIDWDLGEGERPEWGREDCGLYVDLMITSGTLEGVLDSLLSGDNTVVWRFNSDRWFHEDDKW